MFKEVGKSISYLEKTCIRSHPPLLMVSHLNMWSPQNIYRLLNISWEIFGTSSYGKRCTNLQVCLHHMNECQIFHNKNSITVLLNTFNTNLLLSSVLININLYIAFKVGSCHNDDNFVQILFCPCCVIFK